MTILTSHYSDAASQARNAADKTADLWTQGAQGLTTLISHHYPQQTTTPAARRLPQIALIPAVERYFDLVQRTVNINRSLTVKWVQAAGTLPGVARDQAESAADVVREIPASASRVVHKQAAKAEQAHDKAASSTRA